MEISRKTSSIMKGYAILAIALHNFIHIKGFVKCNENSFDIFNTRTFFDHLLSGNPSIWGDFFSFIGWFGVPVFVFLSGYGLTKKYAGTPKIQAGPYIKRNWLKLFWLMLPAVLFYILCSVVNSDWDRIVNSVFSLTLLNNFACISFPFDPGVYWYFGLTFELYLCYLLLHRMDTKGVLITGLVFIGITAAFNPTWSPLEEPLSWVHHNFIGWLPCFIFGILCARGAIKDINIKNAALCALAIIALFAIILLMNWNYYIWLFLPFVIVVFFLLLAQLAERWKPTCAIGETLGKYSACIFASHPIARTFTLLLKIKSSLLLEVVVFIVIAAICAVVYKFVQDIPNRKKATV